VKRDEKADLTGVFVVYVNLCRTDEQENAELAELLRERNVDAPFNSTWGGYVRDSRPTGDLPWWDCMGCELDRRGPAGHPTARGGLQPRVVRLDPRAQARRHHLESCDLVLGFR
jgi:hypothetical protein